MANFSNRNTNYKHVHTITTILSTRTSSFQFSWIVNSHRLYLPCISMLPSILFAFFCKLFLGHISQSTILKNIVCYAILRCFFSSEFDICVFFVSILLNRLLCCKLIFARLFFTNHVCFAFSSLVRSHVLLSSLKRLVCCFHTSFFSSLFRFFFHSPFRSHLAIFGRYVDMLTRLLSTQLPMFTWKRIRKICDRKFI